MSDPIHDNPELGAASHLPLLLACVSATTGPVLELGVGHASTPILHSVLQGTGRHLTSLENHPAWLAAFQHCANDQHTVEAETFDSVNRAAAKSWSVVFIDNSPGQGRAALLKLFLPVADYVVVHDVEAPEVMEPIQRVLDDLMQVHYGEFHEDDTAGLDLATIHVRYRPFTLAVSGRGRPIPALP
jgi:hypothetical protein